MAAGRRMGIADARRGGDPLDHHQPGQGARRSPTRPARSRRARWPTWWSGAAIRSASTAGPSRSSSTARWSTTATTRRASRAPTSSSGCRRASAAGGGAMSGGVALLARRPAARWRAARRRRAAETIAIVGGTVHTLGPPGTIEGGTVVIEDGKIRAVGARRRGAGRRAADRRPRQGGDPRPLRLADPARPGRGQRRSTATQRLPRSRTTAITAAFDVADALNPRSTLIPVNRVEGLTRAVVAPQPGESLIAGQGAVIHLGRGRGDLVVRAPGGDVRGARRERRRARRRRPRRGAPAPARGARRTPATTPPTARPSSAASGATTRCRGSTSRRCVPVVEGELPLVVAVDRASDIRGGAARWREEYKLKLILAGAPRAGWWRGEIAAAKVPVLLDPMVNLPEQLRGPRRDAGERRPPPQGRRDRRLHDRRRAQRPQHQAGARATPWPTACPGTRRCAAMTIVPARIWGLADRYGTLEPGKDADVVVWDGDPLEVTTFAEHVFIRGVEMPHDSRQHRAARPLPGARRRAAAGVPAAVGGAPRHVLSPSAAREYREGLKQPSCVDCEVGPRRGGAAAGRPARLARPRSRTETPVLGVVSALALVALAVVFPPAVAADALSHRPLRL